VSEAIPGVIVTATFLLLSSLTFLFLTEVWSDHSRLIQAHTARQAEYTNTSIAIQSDNLRIDLGCNTVTAPVDNTGQTSVANFSKMELLADYTDTSSAKVVNHLEYITDWVLPSLSPDTRDPNQWNPAETATFKVPISPPIQFDSSGTLVVVTPGGVTDSGYFSCPPTHYFHSETTSITGSAYYQLRGEPPDGIATTLSASIAAGLVGRVRPSPNDGKFVVPLTDTNQIRASVWDITYRLRRDKVDFGFVWFTNANDISLSTPGSWQDIDLSSYLPVGATGAIVEVVNTGTGTAGGAVRGKEDPRDYMSNPSFGPIQLQPETHQWQIVKVDTNRLIQGNVTSTDAEFKLLGYTIGEDPSYFSAPPDITGAAGSWVTMDLAGYVDANADGAILFIVGDNKKYGVREVGSSYSNVDLKLPSKGGTMYLVGLNAAKEFEAYIESGVNIYLVGQTKGSVVYYHDDIAVTDPAIGSWATLDADTFSVPADANGLILTAEVTTVGDLGLRHGDSTDDWNKRLLDDTHVQGGVGLNSANEWQEYMGVSGTDAEVLIAAYTRLLRLDVHADIDVLVRQADGTIRSTLTTDVANTSNITDTDWQTFTATFSFDEYTVVDNTDYFEIDLFAHATTNLSGENVTVDFHIDDPALPLVDQPRVLP